MARCHHNGCYCWHVTKKTTALDCMKCQFSGGEVSKTKGLCKSCFIEEAGAWSCPVDNAWLPSDNKLYTPPFSSWEMPQLQPEQMQQAPVTPPGPAQWKAGNDTRVTPRASAPGHWPASDWQGFCFAELRITHQELQQVNATLATVMEELAWLRQQALKAFVARPTTGEGAQEGAVGLA